MTIRCSTLISVLQMIEGRQHNGSAPAEKLDDDRQTDRYFGGGDGNNEKDENVAIHRSVEPGKTHQRQSDRIEHQLQAHVHHQNIPAHENADKSERKQERTGRQKLVNSDIHDSDFFRRNHNPSVHTPSRDPDAFL